MDQTLIKLYNSELVLSVRRGYGLVYRLVQKYSRKLINIKHHIRPFDYGQVGFFATTDPFTLDYTFANWGSRKWEYQYVREQLRQIGIKDKVVVDIGIGLPSDSNFYQYYVNSGCNLFAYDPDGRIPEKYILSEKCTIFRQSAEKLPHKANSVDVVVILSVIEHLPKKVFDKTISEVHRVLKANGVLLITLDLTYNKQKSARWAILEKTLNGYPSDENDIRIKANDKQVTLELFLKMISRWFKPSKTTIRNKSLPIEQMVYSPRWNSHVAYIRLTKQP